MKLKTIITYFILVLLIVINAYLYRNEFKVTLDPNDNVFQYALVDEAKTIWKNVFSGKLSPFYILDSVNERWAEGFALSQYYSHLPQAVISLMDLMSQIGAYRLFVILLSATQGVFAKINSGLVNTQNAIVQNSLVATNVFSSSFSSLNASIDRFVSKTVTVSEKITSPVVETGDITATGKAHLNSISTNEIKPSNQNLEINLSETSPPDKGTLAKLIIKGLEGRSVATIDAGGNASFSGQLTAQTIQTQSATVSGTLVAKEVQADNINEIQKLLTDIKNQPLPNPQYYQTLPANQAYGQNSVLSLQNITVSGNANLYNASVGNSLTVGNLLIENNSILSLAWELKLSALSDINLFDGSVVIAKDGTITTKGALVAQGGIKTNEIRPLTSQDDLSVVLGERTKFKIKDALGNEVSVIDSSGSAGINELAVNSLSINKIASGPALISSAENFSRNGIFAPAIETNSAAAGTGTLPAGSNEIILYNNTVKNNSLIYITPTSPTQNKSLFVAQKESCQTAPSPCKFFFKVALDSPIESDIKFNWWIVN